MSRVRRISVRIELAEAGVVKQLISAVFYCPVWSEVFFVIARAKARSNPVLADFKRPEIYQSKLDENGLFIGLCFPFLYTPHPSFAHPLPQGARVIKVQFGNFEGVNNLKRWKHIIFPTYKTKLP